MFSLILSFFFRKDLDFFNTELCHTKNTLENKPIEKVKSQRNLLYCHLVNVIMTH